MSFYDSDYINTDGNWIHKTAIIGENVSMGKGNVVMPYAVIGQPGFIREADKMEGMVVIGDNNRIGCHVSIMSGKESETTIGSNNLIMNYANVGHDVVIFDECEIGVGVIIGGHATIGWGSKLKMRCVIRNRVEIKRECIIGMGAVVCENVMEYTTVKGNPAR